MFTMFKELDTGPEEWFRVEVLDAIRNVEGIQIKATNQRYEGYSGRPDFILGFENSGTKGVELKVLP